VRVLHGHPQAVDSRPLLALLEPVRTRAMLLVAAACISAALASQLYPGPLALLFCLLLAAGCTAALRASTRLALVSAIGTVVAFVSGALATSSVGTHAAGPDGTSPGAGAVPGLLLCAILLLGCSLLSLWTSAGVARAPLAWAGGRHRKALLEAPAVLRQDAVLERLDWELGRAGEYRRPLTLCLLGIDPPSAEGDVDASRLEGAMRRVDQLLLQELSRFEVVSEHGPLERLLILPELWADGFADDAARVCALATGRVRRTARAALVTFPFDGTRAETLLADLEASLARCRAGDALLAVGTVGREPVSVTTDFAS
jgi:hypothetical protein